MGPRSASNSRSRSREYENSRTRSRTASKSPQYRRERQSSRSRSPRPRRGRGGGQDRENPPPSRCLGVFNLSSYTTEKDLRDVFGEFGEIDKCELVYDRPSGNSRGFGFIYYTAVDDATAAREKLCNTDLDGHKIRVDYSFTKRGHSPTPGHYMGDRPPGDRGGRFGGDRFRDRGRGEDRGRDRYGDRSGGDRYSRRRSPEGRGHRSTGSSGYMRNGGSDRHRESGDRHGSGGGHRPYDPQFRRRVESYGSGAPSRRSDR